jgi:hypothetical protein
MTAKPRRFLKIPAGWTERGDNSWERRFGPLLFTAYRTDFGPDAGTYSGLFGGINTPEPIAITTAEMGLDRYDDAADATALRELAARAKEVIRGWAS